MEELERRQYFRIDDQVRLSWRLLSPAEYGAILARPESERADPCSLVAQFHSISSQAAALLASIRKSQPEVAHYLTLLDKKLDLMGRLIEGANFAEGEGPNAEVNISAGGLAFLSDGPVTTGSHLDLRIILYPSFVCVHPYAEVVYCREEQAGQYRIGAEFSVISEPEREALVRHVMAHQSALRRRARQGEE